LLGLFTPFTLVCGLLSVAMLVLHGAAWLSIKVEHGPVHDRARAFGTVAAIASILLFATGFAFVAWGDIGYRIVGAVDPLGPSNPLRMTAERAGGAWLDNYATYPWMITLPALGFAGAVLALVGIRRGREVLAFAGSSLAATGIIATVGCAMFPFILPSSIDAHSSLTVWNASSTQKTLGIMLFVTLVFLPIVLAYTAWAYRVMFGRVTAEAVRTNPDFY
jgi:cytochrome d ubiquinol oxidase subunit II